MKFKAFLCSAAVLVHLMAGVTSFPGYAMAASRHKVYSAHFISTALQKKGFKVGDVRRKAQVYFIKVSQDGVVAILAVDAYSANVIGLKIVSMPAGKKPKPKGTAGNRFVDLTYEYGYVVTTAIYEASYTLTTEEISYSEEYTEVSYEESEEVSYSEVEETTESDLDNGDPHDAAGDAEAVANESEDDGTADDAYNAQDSADDDATSADASSADDNPDAAADSADDDAPDAADDNPDAAADSADDDAPDAADDTPDAAADSADDNAPDAAEEQSDDTPDAADDSASDDSSDSSDDSSGEAEE